jgi:hypothetical protein
VLLDVTRTTRQAWKAFKTGLACSELLLLLLLLMQLRALSFYHTCDSILD